jgi:hypothetical protein
MQRQHHPLSKCLDEFVRGDIVDVNVPKPHFPMHAGDPPKENSLGMISSRLIADEKGVTLRR